MVYFAYTYPVPSGNDSFIPRGMQTLNLPSKQKQVQTQPVGDKDTGCMARFVLGGFVGYDTQIGGNISLFMRLGSPLPDSLIQTCVIFLVLSHFSIMRRCKVADFCEPTDFWNVADLFSFCK